MKISHKWLQTFFKHPLPDSAKIAELLTFHIFEVEGVEKKTDDDVLDIKVLPDRACYCLSHEGIARELYALLPDNEFMPREAPEIDSADDVPDVEVTIDADDACDRYVALRALKISTKESPDWIKKRLEAVGQRPINLLADIANFVMLDIGEPMHVFDGEKVSGAISVRYAKHGEEIITLDGKEVTLDSSIITIADDNAPLAIAGIKGGKIAETDGFTKHIIIEAAHFDSTKIRKISSRLGIKTDSAKRFENNADAELAVRAMLLFAKILKEADPEVLLGKIIVSGGYIKQERKIEINPSYISSRLGKDISSDEILQCLKRGSIRARREGETIAVYPESYRKDLNISEDIVDEVGRLYGYENIEAKLPNIKDKIENNDSISYRNKAKNFLIENGYSEISSYALQNKGEIEIANPLASDKSFYRSELANAMEESLKHNLYYADLLGLSKIKLFEFGRVYKNGREYMALSIGVAHKKAKKGERVNDEIKQIRDSLLAELGAKAQSACTVDDTGGIISKDGKQIGTINNLDGILEIDFDAIIDGLPKLRDEIGVNLPKEHHSYKVFSQYPFIVRDVAIFVPSDVQAEDVFDVIKKHVGDLMVRYELFDTFEKGEKTSYAYRLVFQSFDKTLTDDEVNVIMERIWEALKNKGWEVR